MTTPAPAPAPAAAPVPGKVLGIVGLIAAIVWPFQLLGLILSLIARSQSKAAGVPNTPAKAGIIISIILLALTILFWIIAAVTGGISASYNVG
jgi:hypothetical protein